MLPQTSELEGALRSVLVFLFLCSGAVVASGFFFPTVVGAVVSGQIWLVVALVFFGTGLIYLSVLPLTIDSSRTNEHEASETQFTTRRFSGLAIVREFGRRQDPVVFGVAVGGLLLFFFGVSLVPSQTETAVETVQALIMRDGGWLFTGPILLSVVCCLVMLVSSWGSIRLGGPDAEPTYTYPVYFTMFFTAGIAAGIVFWGPAEALFHYQEPPPSLAVQPESEGAIVGALTYTLFHWGLSAWSAYVVIGLPIAYFVYQHGAPLRVSAILTPFLGVDGLDSGWGRLVDLLAVFATIGGIATSVALVSQQFLAGIDHQWGVTYGATGSVLFVAGLTAIFVISAQSGVHRGIRRLSVVTILLFGLVSVLLVIVGPRLFLLDRGSAALGSYGRTFVPMSLTLGTDWAGSWTVWNWSWWFSWAPFAGLFLAALSKGRQLRTVVFTGFVATAAATMSWFLLVGGTALYTQHTGRADILGPISAYGGSEAVAGFRLFDTLALSQLLMFLFLALIICFIATSADTSTLAVSILAARHGTTPTTATIVFWGVFQGSVAIAVLLTGSAETLQTAAVLTGAPFAVISVLALFGLGRTFLRHERGHPSLIARIRELRRRLRSAEE